jgi:hypothetical protein
LPVPKGGTSLAAFQALHRQGWIRDQETVPLFNTGTGPKYTHLWTYPLSIPAGAASISTVSVLGGIQLRATDDGECPALTLPRYAATAQGARREDPVRP